MPAGFWPIWTTVAIDLVGFGIVSPILGRYAERFHAGGLTVGLMFASFSVAQMLFAPILGRISDRVGRKPVIIFSLVGTAVGSVITGAAGAIWVLFLGRIIDGSSGASVSVAQGAIADIAPPEQRARLMGMLGAAFGVGFVLGPAIGGLAALGGPRVPFFIAGAVAGINAIVAFVRLPETKKEVHEPRAAHHARSPRSAVLVRFAVVGFVSTLGFSGFEATFSLFGQRRFNLTEGSAAMVFLVIGLALTAVQGGLIGPLTASLGSGKLLRVGLLVTGAGLAVLAFTPHMVWVMLFASMLLLAFGQGVASPSITALVTETAPPDRRGEALGYQQSAGAFARIAGPIVAGALFDHVGVGAPYVIGAVLAVLAVVVLATSPRQTPVRT
jgi:multidrug resistance protein